MTKTVNIHQAKTHLSRLLEAVRRGEEFIIAKAGKPVARVVPIAAEGKRRRPGAGIGQIKIADDFDAPLPADILDAFVPKD